VADTPANEHGLLEVTHLPKLVRKRGEVAARVFVELFPELVDASGTRH
jgi:hypothetical protein